MISNGELSTTPDTVLITVPRATPGIPRSGNPMIVDFFRIVNESGALRTFNLGLNVNGTVRALVPIDTELPDGSAFDDLPTFQLPPGATLTGDASGASVSWTINTLPT